MVLMVTVSGLLFIVPSFTVRLTTYVPALSAVKVGFADVAPLSAAVLPDGFVVSDQLYVMASPSASELPPPSSVTVLPTYTDWSVPAFATGAELAGVGVGLHFPAEPAL
jgi:hypothetical protein